MTSSTAANQITANAAWCLEMSESFCNTLIVNVDYYDRLLEIFNTLKTLFPSVNISQQYQVAYRRSYFAFRVEDKGNKITQHTKAFFKTFFIGHTGLELYSEEHLPSTDRTPYFVENDPPLFFRTIRGTITVQQTAEGANFSLKSLSDGIGDINVEGLGPFDLYIGAPLMDRHIPYLPRVPVFPFAGIKALIKDPEASYRSLLQATAKYTPLLSCEALSTINHILLQFAPLIYRYIRPHIDPDSLLALSQEICFSAQDSTNPGLWERIASFPIVHTTFTPTGLLEVALIMNREGDFTSIFPGDRKENIAYCLCPALAGSLCVTYDLLERHHREVEQYKNLSLGVPHLLPIIGFTSNALATIPLDDSSCDGITHFMDELEQRKRSTKYPIVGPFEDTIKKKLPPPKPPILKNTTLFLKPWDEEAAGGAGGIEGAGLQPAEEIVGRVFYPLPTYLTLESFANSEASLKDRDHCALQIMETLMALHARNLFYGNTLEDNLKFLESNDEGERKINVGLLGLAFVNLETFLEAGGSDPHFECAVNPKALDPEHAKVLHEKGDTENPPYSDYAFTFLSMINQDIWMLGRVLFQLYLGKDLFEANKYPDNRERKKASLELICSLKEGWEEFFCDENEELNARFKIIKKALQIDGSKRARVDILYAELSSLVAK